MFLKYLTRTKSREFFVIIFWPIPTVHRYNLLLSPTRPVEILRNFREILFEIFSNTEIRDRFDKSDKYWKLFRVHHPENQKVLGLYEVEHIDDPCYVTLAVYSKEYLEYFKNDSINKKHKGIKKGSAGMEYENYAERI